MDYVTTLTTRSKRLKATKTIIREDDGSITKVGYGLAKSFSHTRHAVKHIGDMYELLSKLQTQTQTFIIRGAVSNSAPEVILRRMYGEGAHLYEDPEGHQWLHLDIDGQPLPEGVSLETALADPQIIADYIISKLPSYLHDTSYVYQFSSSMALTQDSDIRIHLWFWLSAKFADIQLREWCKRVNEHLGCKFLDPQVCVTVQPNYTAAPVFVNMPDPVPRRVGLVLHPKDEVHMPETPELLAFTQ